MFLPSHTTVRAVRHTAVQFIFQYELFDIGLIEISDLFFLVFQYLLQISSNLFWQLIDNPYLYLLNCVLYPVLLLIVLMLFLFLMLSSIVSRLLLLFEFSNAHQFLVWLFSYLQFYNNLPNPLLHNLFVLFFHLN